MTEPARELIVSWACVVIILCLMLWPVGQCQCLRCKRRRGGV